MNSCGLVCLSLAVTAVLGAGAGGCVCCDAVEGVLAGVLDEREWEELVCGVVGTVCKLDLSPLCAFCIKTVDSGIIVRQEEIDADL